MLISKKEYVWGILIVFISGCLVFLNTQAPHFIQRHYNEKNFPLLNTLAQTKGELTLDYYQGRIEDQLIGPVTNTLSHLALIGLLVGVLKQLSYWRFVLVIFAFLVASKFHILFYPPYGDAIGGPFAEALWLKDHHFDYRGLLHQPGYLDGGPKVYFFTIYPAYLAVLYKLLPQVQAFLAVNHLLVYVMAAIVVAVTREILKNNLDDLTARLGAVVVLALPLFQSQTEAINMEMPQVCFSALSVWALVRRNIFKATGWAILALSIKGYGVIICGTVFLWSVYVFFFDREKYDWKILLAGSTVLFLAFLNLASKYFLKDQHVSQGLVSLFSGWASLRIMCLPFLFGASAALLGAYWLSGKWYEVRGTKKDLRSTYHIPLTTQCIVLLMCAMWFVLFLNFEAVSPRYKLTLQPFLVMSIIFSLTNFQILRRWAKLFLITAVAIISFGSFGKYYSPPVVDYHVLSERSLEYRNNLKLQMNVCQFLEKNFDSWTIGAPFIFAQMLSIPEFGYVKRPLRVVQYGLPIKYGKIEPYEGLDKLDSKKTVWVGVRADEKMLGDIPYPIHTWDKIIKEFDLGDNRATLFLGGFSIEFCYKIVQNFISQQYMNKK